MARTNSIVAGSEEIARGLDGPRAPSVALCASRRREASGLGCRRRAQPAKSRSGIGWRRAWSCMHKQSPRGRGAARFWSRRSSPISLRFRAPSHSSKVDSEADRRARCGPKRLMRSEERETPQSRPRDRGRPFGAEPRGEREVLATSPMVSSNAAIARRLKNQRTHGQAPRRKYPDQARSADAAARSPWPAAPVSLDPPMARSGPSV